MFWLFEKSHQKSTIFAVKIKFQYSEKYIVLVFIIYLKIEYLHVAYNIPEFSKNSVITFN